MSWFRSPVRLFGYSGIVLVLVRLIFPPADFPGAAQIRSSIKFFDLHVDLTGYGLFEFVAIVFLGSALTYWLVLHLTNRAPKSVVVQLHYWPTLLFAVLSIFLAHWINRLPESTRQDDNTRSILYGFSWALLVFLALQLVFVVGAIRSVWRSRTMSPD